MSSSRDAYENDSCPVNDELLGQMYRANESGLAQLVESVSSDARAMLALFCYRRAHMHSLALAIASSCSERDLFRIGGRVGSALFAQSREAAGGPARAIFRSQADHPVNQAAPHDQADGRHARRRDVRSGAGLNQNVCQRKPAAGLIRGGYRFA